MEQATRDERPPEDGAAVTPSSNDAAGGRANRAMNRAEAAALSASLDPDAKPVPWFTACRIATVRGFLVFWSRLFGLSGLYMLGRFFGTCEFLVDYKRRRRVIRKLTELLGDELTPGRRLAHTRRYFMRIRCDKMFYTIMDRIPRAKLMKRIKLIDGHLIDEGLARGKGVYVALCHFGSHYIAGLMMSLLGYEVSGLRDPKESAVRRYIQQKYRETFPEVATMAVFPANSFPRQVYRRLQNNTLVASLIDPDRKRSENAKWTTVTMFGEERELLAGPLQIAFRCGATTLQGFVVSRKNFYYQLIVKPPLVEPGMERDDDVTIQQAAQRYAVQVEKFARKYPYHIMNI